MGDVKLKSTVSVRLALWQQGDELRFQFGKESWLGEGCYLVL